MAVGLALVVHVTGLLAGLEDASVDQRFRLRPAAPPPDVVVVALDERSLDRLGERPPIPRSLHGRLLDRLRAHEPLAIAYDVQFTEPTQEAEDAALYDAVARTPRVVLATSDVTEDGDTRVFGSTANVERIGARVGSSLLPLSRGGVYRRVEPSVNGVESLAFAAARAAGRAHGAEASREGLLIDYAGPPGTVRTVSFSDVLEGRAGASILRRKAIVVGVTALSQGDHHRTPTHGAEQMSGAEIQANALSTVMRGVPLRDGPTWITVVLIALLAAAGSALAGRLSLARAAICAVALLGATAAGAYAAFRAGVMVEAAAPLAAVLIGAGAGGLERALRARRREHETRELLGRLAGGRDVGELLARIRGDELVLLEPGARFGDFAIDRALGVGGMSVVHLARDVRDGRLVALKVMSARLGDRPDIRDRFIREAQAGSTLAHEAIVPIFDAGEIGGRPYLAMRLVEGGTLADLVGSRQLPPARALELLTPIADALDHAHRRGVIHRDVKPTNVLVDGDGSPYLADFGIAHLLDAGRVTTEFVGTPAYTAPEQVRGEQLTGACDQYALGCVLFECLTGRLPFPDPTVVGLMQAHLAQPPPPASSFVPALGPEIDTVLARALAKQPTDRYPSCSAFVTAARAALGGAATSATLADPRGAADGAGGPLGVASGEGGIRTRDGV